MQTVILPVQLRFLGLFRVSMVILELYKSSVALVNFFCFLDRSFVSFGQRNRSIGAAAKSQVRKNQPAPWTFLNELATAQGAAFTLL